MQHAAGGTRRGDGGDEHLALTLYVLAPGIRRHGGSLCYRVLFHLGGRDGIGACRGLPARLVTLVRLYTRHTSSYRRVGHTRSPESLT